MIVEVLTNAPIRGDNESKRITSSQKCDGKRRKFVENDERYGERQYGNKQWKKPGISRGKLKTYSEHLSDHCDKQVKNLLRYNE